MSSTWSSLKSSSSKKPKVRITKLSDEELRTRIFANASILFPTPPHHLHHHLNNNPTNLYEVVYATRPKTLADKQISPSLSPTDPPWQYALLVRRDPLTGEATPLLRGQAWSSPVPWSMVLQGLLDTTSVAIHRKFAAVALSPTAVIGSQQQQQQQQAQPQPQPQPQPQLQQSPHMTTAVMETGERIDAELPPYERSSSSLLLESGAIHNRLQRLNIEESRRLAAQSS